MNFTNEQVLVVGASGALGTHFANQLIAAGTNVIATTHKAENISKLNAQITEKYVLDLTATESIEKLISELTQKHKKISGVIIASGVVGFNPAESTDPKQLQEIAQINYLGPAQLINSLFPLLKADSENGSFVLGITGVVVEQTFPGMSAYTSSKAAFSAYLQSIAKEWRRYKIKVTEARLGHTETGLANRAIFGTAPQMPVGLDPEKVVANMLNAVSEKKNLISSVDFN